MTAAVAPPERSHTTDAGVRPVASALHEEWRELGGLGRLATVGLIVSAVVAVVLGLWIDESVRHHLLDVRTEVIQSIIDDLAADGLLPIGSVQTPAGSRIDAAIEHRLIGGETVAVSVRDTTGAVVYDTPEMPDTGPRTAQIRVPHVEQHPDGLLHFRLPVTTSDGTVAGAFEVFQQADSFNEVVARVRRNLWLSIGTGLGTLGIAMGALTLSHARALDRRRRHAEQLLRELLQVEDEERRRIVGALHDDIGQPLYRVLYGLEGCRARLEEGSAIRTELQHLDTLVRDVDRTLRNELKHLHRPTLEPLALMSALQLVAQGCSDECDLVVNVEATIANEPTPTARMVLLRAIEEALTNVRKHAKASHVLVRAFENGRWTTVEVIDDGRGSTAPRGLGLTSTAERLAAIGGGLSVHIGATGGTVFRAWIPTRRDVTS